MVRLCPSATGRIDAQLTLAPWTRPQQKLNAFETLFRGIYKGREHTSFDTTRRDAAALPFCPRPSPYRVSRNGQALCEE